MLSLRRLLPALAISAIATLSAAAQTEAPAAKPESTVPVGPTAAAAPVVSPETGDTVLTLEECVRRALDKNFDLKIEGYSRDSARDNLEVAKATFDPTLQLRTQRYASKTSTGSFVQDGVVVSGTPRTTDGDATSLSVGQRIATGATVTLTGNLDRTKSRPSGSLPNPAYDSDVGVTVRQPLLRNAGTRVNRAAIERAKLGINIANLDFKGSVLTVVRNVETAYYNLAFAREQLNVRKFSLEVAEKLFDENRSRRATGVATDLDVLQAEVGVANARRNVLLAQQSVKDREDALLAEIQPFAFSTQLGQIQLIEEPIPTVNGDFSYKLARENSPDYVAQQTYIQQLKIDSDIAKRNKLPTLDVGAGAGYNAREDSYSTAARRVWNGDRYSWSLDATLSLPWGLRAEKARYRQSITSVNREEVRLQQMEQDILVRVRAAVRAVETNLESVRISSLATELSQRQYDLEKARYDAGLSTFRRVQEAKEDLDTSRVSELQAKVTLRNALADLSRLEGSSLQRYKIAVE